MKNTTSKQLTKKFNVTKIDGAFDSDEPVYFKKTSPKATFFVFPAGELAIDNNKDDIPFKSGILCEVRN
jgi:hypothetical protein